MSGVLESAPLIFMYDIHDLTLDQLNTINVPIFRIQNIFLKPRANLGVAQYLVYQANTQT
jgi:hypothetical protein